MFFPNIHHNKEYEEVAEWVIAQDEPVE